MRLLVQILMVEARDRGVRLKLPTWGTIDNVLLHKPHRMES